MTRHPLRAALVFATLLVALAAGAYAAQQTLYARAPVLDLTPAVAPPPVALVPAPRESISRGESDAGLPSVDPAWLRRTSSASGVPEVALRAYARAELGSPSDCGVGWTTLAGIGWVESQHGTLSGRDLLADGHSSSLILGPALNGVGNVAAIASTSDSRRWHGDPQWDHAFGPMQFIPSTWETWASDGDGDGVSDPNDLDDAAFAAARYLCANGRDLTTAAGWTGGVLSYNHAQVYVEAVHAAATTYADRSSA